MSINLLIVAVARIGDGRSYIGFDTRGQGAARFVRLIAPTPSGILYPQQYQLRSGGEPRRWDLVRVEAPWADSRPMQPENRIVNRTPWELVERPASARWIRLFEQQPAARGALLGTRGRAVRESRVAVDSSVACVEPEHPRAVCEWDPRRGRYRARLHFLLDGEPYDLAVSDLTYSPVLRRMPEGSYALEEIGCRAPHGLRLLISLGEPLHGWCYKTVAGILPRRTVTLMRDGTSSTFSDAVRHAADNAVEYPRSFVVGA
jgi:hypothetical protein